MSKYQKCTVCGNTGGISTHLDNYYVKDTLCLYCIRWAEKYINRLKMAKYKLFLRGVYEATKNN